jgi:hypothetical protein
MIGSWLQTGIGIDSEGETFRAIFVRRQWNRLRVVDRLEIPAYRKLEASECGRLYRAFLRKHGLKAPQTVVALPRSAALLRSLTLPQTVEKELARAVEYQVESLHPFEEGGVYWDFAEPLLSLLLLPCDDVVYTLPAGDELSYCLVGSQTYGVRQPVAGADAHSDHRSERDVGAGPGGCPAGTT